MRQLCLTSTYLRAYPLAYLPTYVPGEGARAAGPLQEARRDGRAAAGVLEALRRRQVGPQQVRQPDTGLGPGALCIYVRILASAQVRSNTYIRPNK